MFVDFIGEPRPDGNDNLEIEADADGGRLVCVVTVEALGAFGGTGTFDDAAQAFRGHEDGFRAVLAAKLGLAGAVPARVMITAADLNPGI